MLVRNQFILNMNSRSKSLLVLLITIAIAILCFKCRTIKDYNGNSKPISHEKWSNLLKTNVNENGQVNYKGIIEEKDKFYEYINLLNNNHPNTKNWTKNERLAYWINAYNAYTVQLIIENYPLESIKDIKNGIPFINSSWDIKFIEIEGKTYDLNNIEHNILRKKFNEPRIHFAINCASVSCPALRTEAYETDKIEVQLEEQARLFLGNNTKNKIDIDKVELSKIFSWFGKDFKKDGTLIQYINQYTNIDIKEDAEQVFLKYDWNLNE